jgi:hypothetical protein
MNNKMWYNILITTEVILSKKFLFRRRAMKKLFLILSLAVINFNVYADNRSKVMESVNKDMILNQRIKKVEGIKKVLVGEAKNLISITVTKDIKNINIDIFDENGKRIVNESIIDGLSIIERAGLSNISLESFEKDGKLFLEFNGIQKDQEIDLEISIESEDIYDIEQILDIEYME